MKLRPMLASLLLFLAALPIDLPAAEPEIMVYKTSFCGCCSLWGRHLKANGFQVKEQDVSNLAEIKRQNGVPDALQSCHTAIVEGYVIEGHVPAADIHRLLKERPKAKGLAVPGMPMGSPGMEGAQWDKYSVLLFDADGKTTVFQEYPGD